MIVSLDNELLVLSSFVAVTGMRLLVDVLVGDVNMDRGIPGEEDEASSASLFGLGLEGGSGEDMGDGDVSSLLTTAAFTKRPQLGLQ